MTSRGSSSAGMPRASRMRRGSKERKMQQPRPRVEAASCMVWAAMPMSMALRRPRAPVSPMMTMYPEGRSPASGPSQSASMAAHFRAGKTAAQASGDSATAKRRACALPPQGATRAQETIQSRVPAGRLSSRKRRQVRALVASSRKSMCGSLVMIGRLPSSSTPARTSQRRGLPRTPSRDTMRLDLFIKKDH